MTKQEFLTLCASFGSSVTDQPFGDEHTVVRHAGSRKWFDLIFIRDGKLCANLKCDPQKAGFWRSAYQAVTPAWHMNKTHWNTVELNAGIPREDLMEMVADSFNLTAPKTRGHK